jgi:quercetin dioxygenase-like cupin family protein
VRPLVRAALGFALTGIVACGARAPERAPRLGVGGLATGLEEFLAAHPRPPGEAIRVDLVERAAGASYHVVQVRGSERPHRHVAHDLTVIVLRGAGTLVLGARRLPQAAGDVTLIPAGTVHWFASSGENDAVALAIFTPPLDAPDSVPADVVDSPTGRR